ncbi:hypothetical protein ACMBCN_01765 [Candidatus Liberibacter asiaticus]|nr:hypothetical protein [Candidatus Liberibacter asiaticus]
MRREKRSRPRKGKRRKKKKKNLSPLLREKFFGVFLSGFFLVSLQEFLHCNL